jgi:hypothetical protein
MSWTHLLLLLKKQKKKFNKPGNRNGVSSVIVAKPLRIERKNILMGGAFSKPSNNVVRNPKVAFPKVCPLKKVSPVKK